jgi:hypothetical protein
LNGAASKIRDGAVCRDLAGSFSIVLFFSYEQAKSSAFYFYKFILFLLLAVKTFDRRTSVDISFSRGLKMKIKNLAKLAGVSPLTIDRIERGMPCRIKSQRQIVLALGLKVSEKRRVFHDN